MKFFINHSIFFIKNLFLYNLYKFTKNLYTIMLVKQKSKKFQLSRSDEAFLAASKIVDYNLPTKIGYWNEKLALQLEKMALIKKKRGRCETLTIRRNIMYENLNKPSRLHEPNMFIHYGDPIHIATDELQTKMLGIEPAVLAAIVTERDIDVTLNLCHGCPVIASHNREPILRNVMKILDPLKLDRKGDRITYGKDILISVYDSNTDRKLYIQALVPTFDNFGGGNDHLIIRLSECPDRYCKFKILHMRPEMRDFTYGDHIPSNTPVCITHTVTNKFLVTENKYVPTFFGSEMEISCFNYKQNLQESPAAYWELAIEKQKPLITKLDDKGPGNQENLIQNQQKTDVETDKKEKDDIANYEARMYRCDQ